MNDEPKKPVRVAKGSGKFLIQREIAQAALRGQRVIFSDSLPGLRYVGRIHDDVLYEAYDTPPGPDLKSLTGRLPFKPDFLPEFQIRREPFVLFSEHEPSPPPALFSDVQAEVIATIEHDLMEKMGLTPETVLRPESFFTYNNTEAARTIMASDVRQMMDSVRRLQQEGELMQQVTWLMHRGAARWLKRTLRRVARGNRRDLKLYSKGMRKHRRALRTAKNKENR